MVIKRVTAKAPMNIALIKYWGKRDEELIIPLNDSLSITLSAEYMSAKTTVAISPDFEEDAFWLNGSKESLGSSRYQKVIKTIKDLARQREPREELEWKIRISSANNFPTAAGLASSAAGFACLVFALAKLYNIDEDLSKIARQGSGSACRSIFGGFVRWYAGTAHDGSDSFAKQLYPARHWPELRCLIIVANGKRKATSSTVGMRRAVETSELLQHRIKHCVPQRVQQITEAIKMKDFHTLGEIMMRDSNQFHAICLDTYPPEFYMNNVSQYLISFVHEFNAAMGETKVAYTFDAGPNACLFVLEPDVRLLLKSIITYFKYSVPPSKFLYGIPIDIDDAKGTKSLEIPVLSVAPPTDCIQYIIHTEIGDGPVRLDEKESYISDTGEILNLLPI